MLRFHHELTFSLPHSGRGAVRLRPSSAVRRAPRGLRTVRAGHAGVAPRSLEVGVGHQAKTSRPIGVLRPWVVLSWVLPVARRYSHRHGRVARAGMGRCLRGGERMVAPCQPVRLHTCGVRVRVCARGLLCMRMRGPCGSVHRSERRTAVRTVVLGLRVWVHSDGVRPAHSAVSFAVKERAQMVVPPLLTVPRSPRFKVDRNHVEVYVQRVLTEL
mmetsp:Transcript_32346/g.84980  ORF Transcript_32346/g.84980 Transcript_32346/m.84980 type:complete len:215 (-) Transcript_32346:1047-1691(-)